MNPTIADQFAGKDSKSKVLLVSLVSALFSLLIFSVPWESLHGMLFEDKQVYLNRFLYLQSIIEEHQINTIGGLFVNEALWDYLIRSISGFGIPIDMIFGGITLLCLFTFAKFLISRHGFISVLLLINPLVIDFAFDQLRMAFAVSILALTFILRRKIAVLFVVVCACFIHTASVLLVLMYLIPIGIRSWFRKKRFSAMLLTFALICLGVMVALMIGPLREDILSYIGDRRAVYELGGANISYVYFWFILLLTYLFQKEKFYQHDSNLFAVVCVSTVISATLLDTFGIRFISATFPIILSSMLTLDRTFKPILVPSFILFSILQWVYWLHLYKQL